MSRVLTFGPNGTPVEGVTALSFTLPPLNFEADFGLIEEGVGKVIYTDLTSPQEQPSTLRIAQTSRANVYAGTSIDPSVYLANKRGTDTIVEVREIWADTESTDPSILGHAPVRCAITLTVPDSAIVTDEAVERLLARCVAAFYKQGEATPDAGITALLHGVVKKV